MPVLPGILDQIRNNELESLDLSNMNLTNDDVLLLCDAMQYGTVLTSINISQNQSINEKSIIPLIRMPLKSLNISYNEQFRIGQIIREANPSLESLDISGNHLMIEDIEVFANNNLKSLTMIDVDSRNGFSESHKSRLVMALVTNRSITSLDVSCNGLMAYQIEMLIENPYLSSLKVNWSDNFDTACMEALENNTSLKALGVAYCDEMHADYLSRIAAKTSLESLEISGYRYATYPYYTLDTNIVRALISNPSLKSLSIESSKVDPVDLGMLFAYPALESLKLHNIPGITNDHLRLLAANTSLKSLILRYFYIDADYINFDAIGIGELESSKTLESLEVDIHNKDADYIAEPVHTSLPILPRLLDQIRNDELESLDLSDMNLTNDDVLQICAAMQHSTILTSINISQNQSLNEKSIIPLIKMPLKSLDISYSEQFHIGQIIREANPSLESLDISGNHLMIEDIEVFATNTLKSLAMIDVDSRNGFREIDKNRLVMALAANRSITSLDVSCNDLTAYQIKILLKNPYLSSLKVNWGYGFNSKCVEAFEKNLTLKSLGVNQCDEMSADYLSRIAAKTSLESLEISGYRCTNYPYYTLDTNIIRALITNPSLKSLSIVSSNIDHVDLGMLLSHPSLESITLFNISGLTNNHLRMIATNTSIKSLTLIYYQFDADYINFDSTGIKMLAASTTLQSLELTGYKIDDAVIEAIARNTTLQSLTLNDDEIDDDAASKLASNTTLKSLTLIRNKIGDAGALSFAQNNYLESLNLKSNKIGPIGAKAFENTHSLLSLSLSGNADISFELRCQIMMQIQEHVTMHNRSRMSYNC